MLGFFLNLVFTGWAISQAVTGILLALWIGGGEPDLDASFLLAPFSCIYYPLETLPLWMQSIAQYLSTTYVFEGMRALILKGEWVPELLGKAFLLNAIYFILGLSVFCLSLRSARRRGLLLQSGE